MKAFNESCSALLLNIRERGETGSSLDGAGSDASPCTRQQPQTNVAISKYRKILLIVLSIIQCPEIKSFVIVDLAYILHVMVPDKIEICCILEINVT